MKRLNNWHHTNSTNEYYQLSHKKIFLQDEGLFAKGLKVAVVTIVDFKQCSESYKRSPITNNMFCAGIGDADACKIDSGGPGVINGKLVGIVSSGIKCKNPKYPSVYTTVSKYRDWILKKTNNNTLVSLVYKLINNLYNKAKLFYINIMNVSK